MSLYPVMLELNGKPCLVVGGGSVAERRVRGLLDAAASVTVVSPSLTAGLADLLAGARACHRRREYVREDLEGCCLVVAATDSAAVNGRICREAASCRILSCSATETTESSFQVPAVVRRGDLILAISTSGRAPLLARELGRMFAERLYPGIERDVEALGAARQEALCPGGDDRSRTERARAFLGPRVRAVLERITRSLCGEGEQR